MRRRLAIAATCLALAACQTVPATTSTSAERETSVNGGLPTRGARTGTGGELAGGISATFAPASGASGMPGKPGASAAPGGVSLTGGGAASPGTKPAPGASIGPSGLPLPVASNLAGAHLDLLQPLIGKTKAFAGTVLLDASVLVGAGQGKLATVDGETVLQVGSEVVSNNAGNIVSDHGSGIVANNGGGAVADDGTSFLAAGGASASYHLDDAEAGAPQRVPASGMLVSVVSLATHRYLPLGTNSAGQPAYTILTDAHGKFSLYLDATQADNVVVVASAPGTTSHHAAVNLVTAPAGTGSASLDPDVTVAAKFVRRALVTVFVRMLSTPEALQLNCRTAKEPINILLGPFLQDLQRAVAHADTKDAGAARQVALAQVLADYLLARVDLGSLTSAPAIAGVSAPGLAPEPAAAAVADVARQIDAAAASHLATNPTFFTCGAGNAALDAFCNQVNVAAQSVGGLTVPPVAATVPADVSDYAMGTLLDTPSTQVAQTISQLLAVAGVADPVLQQDRAIAADTGIQIGLVGVLNDPVTGDDAKRGFLSLLDPTAPPVLSSAPPPSPSCGP